MMKMLNKFAAAALTIMAVTLAAASDTAIFSHPTIERHTFRTMGTVAGLAFCGIDGQQAQKLFKQARNEFDQITARANLYDPSSELCRLNAIADREPFICSPELYQLLTEARLAWRDSEGAFDITALPLMKMWGFYRKEHKSLPTVQDIEKNLALTGLDKVVFDDQKRSVFFPVKGMQLDLGGIAKGYAVDRAMNAVSSQARRIIIDLGGNLKLHDQTGQNFNIGIYDPLQNNRIERTIQVSGGAISTSGGYERFVTINNRRYSHIIDPVSGHPADKHLAVTVITPLAVRADWMSTAIFIRGAELARELVKKYPHTTVFIYKKPSEKSNRDFLLEIIKSPPEQ